MFGLPRSKRLRYHLYRLRLIHLNRDVILFSPSASKGVKIDYPSIALHALGSQNGQAAVYLQLDLHDKDTTNDDDDIRTLTLHITPQAISSAESSADSNGATNGVVRCTCLTLTYEFLLFL